MRGSEALHAATGCRSSIYISAWVARRILNFKMGRKRGRCLANAFYWRFNREVAAASEADRLPGRDRAASFAGGAAVLFAATRRAHPAWGPDDDQGGGGAAECFARRGSDY